MYYEQYHKKPLSQAEICGGAMEPFTVDMEALSAKRGDIIDRDNYIVPVWMISADEGEAG